MIREVAEPGGADAAEADACMATASEIDSAAEEAARAGRARARQSACAPPACRRLHFGRRCSRREFLEEGDPEGRVGAAHRQERGR